jgi:hypothetical protein
MDLVLYRKEQKEWFGVQFSNECDSKLYQLRYIHKSLLVNSDDLCGPTALKMITMSDTRKGLPLTSSRIEKIFPKLFSP